MVQLMFHIDVFTHTTIFLPPLPPPNSDWLLDSFYPQIHTANPLLLSYFFINEDGMSVHVS